MAIKSLAAALLCLPMAAYSQDAPYQLPMAVGAFEQHVHHPYTAAEGLPSDAVSAIAIDAEGRVVATTSGGVAAFDGAGWITSAAEFPAPVSLTETQERRLRTFAGEDFEIRAVASYNGEFAVAADTGLYIGAGRDWQLALPREGAERWAPVDVRAVTYDATGALWFAAPQGVGYRVSKDEWKLFTGADGLPYNEFTSMAAGPDSVWFGTTNGAIQYRDGQFHFRQGRRWLLDNSVTAIAVDNQDSAWIATSAGVSQIADRTLTLAEKVAFYQDEIDKYNRRTTYGYVNPADLAAPGDKSTAVPAFTDNDGHNTGLYLGAVGLGYAATGDPKLKQDAVNAFRALAFLSDVTQGGTHPAPEGFIARTVRPTSEPDPNPQFDLAYDQRRQERDAMWKIIQPRWPVDETGEWYWKNDSSSDELDGHFFGYAIYFDRVCETEAEKDEVREVVRRIADHLLIHGYNLVDYDGKPTRWGRFSPDEMNRSPAWVTERGLNCYSVLTYFAIAHRVTGDAKYREAYLELAYDHGYGMNGMTQPKDFSGPGSHGQPDDNMAFVNYYHLIRYETDPTLLSMYYRAINHHWQVEKYERSPFFNFVYAASCLGKIRSDQWGDHDMSPPRPWLEDAVETLKRYPLDLVDWRMSNSHRIDMVRLGDHTGQGPNGGHRVDGYVFPIDERYEIYWDRDPWYLDAGADGLRLREGYHYMLAYYLGRVHGFIAD